MLAEFWRQGNLKGETAADAFYVTCNSSNNTAVSIDNGEVRIEVGVALQYPAEFIVINLSQWTGGSNAIENI
jgi:phage tail sheath protein FI